MRNASIVYGIRAVAEGIKDDRPIDKIFLQRGCKDNIINQLENLNLSNRIKTSYVPKQKLDKLTKNANHQGVVAIISSIEFQTLESLVENLNPVIKPLLLLLDGITDVRNFGAIIRTAECCGVNGIIMPKSGSAPVNADTIKTSSGAAFRVPMAKVDHIKDAIYYLKASGIKIVAATEKTDQRIYDLDLTQPTAIVMGSEDKGISSSVLKMVDYKAKLPLMGEIGSLNVSVACGAFLYEAVRQRMPGP